MSQATGHYRCLVAASRTTSLFPPLFAGNMATKSNTKTKDEQSELIQMMKGLQATMGSMDQRFKDQGDKLDNLASGQSELRDSVTAMTSKHGAMEKEISNIKSDHTKMATDFTAKFNEWSERITAREAKRGKASWVNLAERGCD